jgi:hypothetical protein
MFRACLVLSIALLVPLAPVLAADDADAYVKVEVKGRLETGIVAIGGETTGRVIHVGKVTWELDLKGDKELEALAEQLNGKDVLLTGLYRRVPGVEIRERHIVTVETLKATH